MTTAEATLPREAVSPRVGRLRSFFSNPWGKPRFLSVWTWLYIIWTIAPVVIAVQFSFNSGRSRSTFQGFSTQWYEAIWNSASDSFDDTLLPALMQSLKLALLTMPIATALGVGLAIGLARWRGRGAGAANFLMLFPLVTPEIVMGVSMFLIFSNLYHFRLGTTAQLLGHVTFSLSYVVIVTRGRLFAIGRDYEDAAMDLGATYPMTLRKVLLPLVGPSLLSAWLTSFIVSFDEVALANFLAGGDPTFPVFLYGQLRFAGRLPVLIAMAVLLMTGTIILSLLAYRLRARDSAI